MATNEKTAHRTLGVVIPTVGERPELKQMLLSILAQTRPVQAIRIVVDASDTSLVDNIIQELDLELGSTDLVVSSTGIARAEGEYLVDTGYGFAVNRGLETLDTDLVAFLDDDDELGPSHFAQLEAALDPTGGRGVAYSRVLVVLSDGNTYLFPKDSMAEGNIPAGVLIDAHPVLLPATLIHRSVLDIVGRLDQSLDRLADTDMVVRLGLATEFAAVNDPTYIYNRVSRKALINERVLAETAHLLKKHQSHLTKRERFLFWDTQARSSLRAGLPALGQDASEQLVSVFWAKPPRFIVNMYLRLRRRQTPQFLKRLAKRTIGPTSGKDR